MELNKKHRPGWRWVGAILSSGLNAPRVGHRNGKDPFAMTKRSWLRTARAASNERRNVHDFGCLLRIRSTGESCPDASQRASMRNGGGPGLATNGTDLARGPTLARRTHAGGRATASYGPRRARPIAFLHSRRRTCTATATSAHCFGARARVMRATDARHESARARAAHVPSLCVAPPSGTLRSMPALQATTGGARC